MLRALPIVLQPPCTHHPVTGAVPAPRRHARAVADPLVYRRLARRHACTRHHVNKVGGMHN